MGAGVWMRVGAAALATLGLAGCIGDEAAPAPSSHASADEPTDDELVAEAEEVSTEFVRLIDVSFTNLVVPDEIYDVASEEVVSNISADVQGFVDQGYRLEGVSTLDNLVAAVERPEGERIRVVMAGCYDTSANRVVDAGGQPVPGEGVVRHPLSLTAERIDDVLVIVDTEFSAEPDGGQGCEP